VKHLILITGPKGHGKDTVAKEIRDQLGYESGPLNGRPYYRAHLEALALPLKQMTCTVSGISMHDLGDRVIKEAIHPALSMSPRDFQITVAKALVGRDPTFFVKLWKQRADRSACPIGVVSDMRFPHEYDCFRELYPDTTIHVVNVRRREASYPEGAMPPSEAMGWCPPLEAYRLETVEGRFDLLTHTVRIFLQRGGLL
jgi:hypothetical protein